jgi:hypothetical protein
MSLTETEGASAGRSGAGWSGPDLALTEAVRDVCRTPSFPQAAMRADNQAAEPIESIRAQGALSLNQAALAVRNGARTLISSETKAHVTT